MALNEVEIINTTMDTELTSYTAGDEPWQKNLDGFTIASEPTENSEYVCDWTKWHGIYRKIPEIKTTIDLQANWIISKEITYKNKAQEKQVKRINGNGKDTFRGLLRNAKKVSQVCGDSFAEKIKDKAGRLINLKPLDPGTIRVVGNQRGIILRYEQVAIKSGTEKSKEFEVLHVFTPDQIFHIINQRVADEIHGIPESEVMINTVKMKHQTMMDYQTIFHRYGKPTYFFEAESDDETEMLDIKTKIDKAMKDFENVIVSKGTLDEIKNIKTAQLATIDPIPWLNFLKSYFTTNSGAPDIVQGESRESAVASANINYIGYKEKIIFAQIEYEEQIEAQLGIELEFERPREITHEITDPAENPDKPGTQQKTNSNPNMKAKLNQKGGNVENV